MNVFLDTLRERHADATKRLTEATQRFQKMQSEMQSLQQEASSLAIVIQREVAREQAEQATRIINQETLPLIGNANLQIPHQQPKEVVASEGEINKPESEVNKTELIRDALQRHPGGMAPGEVWKEVRGQISNRSYVYAVLARLKDREQVTVRRGKYIFRLPQKPTEEGKTAIQ